MTPYFTSISEFISMGGHGVFVWTCYAITLLAVAVLVVWALSERKSTIAKINRQLNLTASQSRLTNKQRRENKTA